MPATRYSPAWQCCSNLFFDTLWRDRTIAARGSHLHRRRCHPLATRVESNQPGCRIEL